MIYHIIPTMIALALIIIGHVVKQKKITSYNTRIEFTDWYHNIFCDFLNETFKTGCISPGEKYNMVMGNVCKIQEELGMDGVIAQFSDPLKGIQINNYQLFMNIMPEIRTTLFNMSIMDNMDGRITYLIGACKDAIIRHIGNLEREIEQERKELWNPITCMGEGIRWIVGLPVDILQWAGLYSASGSRNIKGSIIFKTISNLIILIGLIGSIVTIVLGWDEFWEIINNGIYQKIIFF